MARIYYYQLGADKQLNQIVVAGSHDAGITGGAVNVKTQQLDIFEQATAGVRVFDIRIKSVGKGNQATLKTYHGTPKDPAKESIKGAWGEGLTRILTDARRFVTTAKYRNEFLILKFDKCSNWPDIAAACVHHLRTNNPNPGDSVIYKGTGNLNTKTLQDLAGSVVCLFTPEGYREVKNQYPPGSGILCVRSIASAGYDPDDFHGMQYCGKGGTDWKSGENHVKKIDENYRKQKNIMKSGLGQGSDPDVIGMMYWTTTGFLESIRERNDAMWVGGKAGQVPRELKFLFKQGLKESIQDRIAKSVDPTNHAAGTILKVFMPNIVMIDFADRDKCTKIYDLNRVTSSQLVKAFQEVDREVQAFQQKQARMQIRGDRVKM